MSIKLQSGNGLPQPLPRSRQSIRLNPLSTSPRFTTGSTSEEDLQLASEVRALPDIVPVAPQPKPFGDGTENTDAAACDGPDSSAHILPNNEAYTGEDSTISRNSLQDEESGSKRAQMDTAPSVTEKLRLRRQERHDTTLKELEFSLERIQDQMSTQIRDLAYYCRSILDEKKVSIKDRLSAMENDVDLLQLNQDEVQNICSAVRKDASARGQAISQMIASLEATETERKECIAAALREHGKILFNIAYMVRPEIERLLFEEARKLNEWTISDRATVVDLRARMLISELVFAEQLEHQLADRLRAWQLVQQEHATLNLLRVVQDDSTYLAQRTAAVQELASNAHLLHTALNDALHALVRVVPEGVEDAAVEQRVNVAVADIADVHRARNNLHGQAMERLRQAALNDMDDVTAHVDTCRIALVRDGACAADAVTALVEARVAAARQERCDRTIAALEELDTALMDSSVDTEARASTVVAEVQQVAAAAQQYRTRQTALEAATRARIAQTDQDHAAARAPVADDIARLVDQLRNAETVDSTNALHREIESNMELIAATFTKFRNDATTHLATLQTDAMTLNAKYCEELESIVGADIAATPSTLSGSASREGSIDISTIPTLSHDAMVQKLQTFRTAVHTTLSTSTQTCQDYLEGYIADEGLAIQATVDMHLNMHQAKLARIREDVYNVRIAEFAAHSESVQTHCDTIESALASEQARFLRVQEAVTGRAKEFSTAMDAVGGRLEKIDSVTLLHDALRKATTLSEQFQAELRSMLQSYRRDMDACLHALRESNGALRSSFHTFSEGGSHSTAEIETFKATLGGLVGNIDDTEGRILDVLNVMEGEQVVLAQTMLKTVSQRHAALLCDVALHEETEAQLRTAQVHVRGLVAASNALSARVDASLGELLSGDASDVDGGGSVVDRAERLSALLHERARDLGALKPFAEPDGGPAAATTNASAPRADSTTQASKDDQRGSKGSQGKPPQKNPKGKPRAGKNTPELTDWTTSGWRGAFLSAIHALRMGVRERLAADVAVPYYDALHNKPPLRGDLVPATVHEFVRRVEDRLGELSEHAVAYQRQCIAEFFDQVSQANKQVRSAIPHSLQSATVYGVHTDNADALASCAAVVAQWRQKSTALMRELRPALGHQRNATALADLQAKETASREGVDESVLAACRLQQDDAIAAALADVRALCSARDRLLRVCGAYHGERCNRRRRPCRSACRATPTALRMPLSVAHHTACYRCIAHCYPRCTRILRSVARTCVAIGFLWGAHDIAILCLQVGCAPTKWLGASVALVYDVYWLTLCGTGEMIAPGDVVVHAGVKKRSLRALLKTLALGLTDVRAEMADEPAVRHHRTAANVLATVHERVRTAGTGAGETAVVQAVLKNTNADATFRDCAACRLVLDTFVAAIQTAASATATRLEEAERDRDADMRALTMAHDQFKAAVSAITAEYA
eukprot:m.1192742 g.1192742  ORF g.1192742 m.1192742 type:complete len:1455 (+) comp24557_c0_seq7:85-4449(+)